MNARTTLFGGAVAAVAIFVLLCCVGVILPLISGTTAQAQCNGANVMPAAPATPTPGPNAWSPIQRQHAATIVAVGRQRGVPPRGWVIAVATSMQESKLLNLANDAVPNSLRYPNDGVGHEHDSVGLFQQRIRPPEGQGTWGNAAELMQSSIAATKSFKALGAVRDWWTMRLTDAAQAVQRSATPGAYQQWEEQAERLVASVASHGSWAILGGLEQCVSTAGWTHPLPGYEVTSGFRTAERPSHDACAAGDTNPGGCFRCRDKDLV